MPVSLIDRHPQTAAMKSPSRSVAAAPFREAAEDYPRNPEDDPRTDADLAPVFLLTWLTCSITTIAAIVRGETFGGATTLAALAALLVPYLLRGWLRPRRRG
ncbi:hypothetical protein BE17_05405 [Sorangium cellulosum]|uniref:Uncharacterized protein n=1 Tax=Sorangium cellulosum TaxID=56 RepID=A0A150QUS6_SORCE|nr:hypothetical protein BE17_05405 [Sorangium cellulosum]